MGGQNLQIKSTSRVLLAMSLLTLPACMLDGAEQDTTGDIGETQQEVCAAGGLTLSATTGTVGTNVTLTAGAPSCGGGETPEYQFWARDPNTLTWSIIQAWSADNDVIWDSTGENTGRWWFQAWVRDDATNVTLDSYNPGSFVLTNSAACTGNTITSPASTGTTIHSADNASVAITASATCAGTANYRFWHLSPGGSWTEEQAYGASATWNWATTGETAGWHNFQVWARNSDSSNPYEQVAATNAKLITPCTAAGFSWDLASPQTAGTTVTATMTSTCSGVAAYQVWARPPGGAWSAVQGYSTTNTFTWDTTGADVGTWSFQFWVRNSGSNQSQEKYVSTTYTIQ